jgi:hypothetical protein
MGWEGGPKAVQKLGGGLPHHHALLKGLQFAIRKRHEHT